MLSTDSSAGKAGYLSTPDSRQVREALERILDSPYMQASRNRRAFLRFIVEETLAGRSDHLKGFTIAVTVFGRDESFDAQSDPVVRVEARRLRRDLDSYYMNAGNTDSVRISIPKGAYVPHFENFAANKPRVESSTNESSKEDDSRNSREDVVGSRPISTRDRNPLYWAMLAAGVAAVAIVIAFGWLNTSNTPNGPGTKLNEPSIVVLPFESVGSSRYSNYLATGINLELVNNLNQFPGFRLFSLLNGQEVLPHEREILRDASYVISGSILGDNQKLHLVVHVTFAETNEVVWSESYDRPLNPGSMIELQRELASSIAAKLGQPYGYIQSDLQTRVATPAVSNMLSYVCVLRAYDYRRDFTIEKFEPVMNCLNKAVKIDPGYSDAWAMLGWLLLDGGRFDFSGQEHLQDQYEKAFQAASKAVLIEPDNTLALKALSSINHYMGHFDEGERLARRAAELNPNDPDALAQLGWRLAVRGNFDEGIPILERAIKRSVSPPGWYFHLIAVDHYMAGEYEQMLQVAKRSAIDGSIIGQGLIVIASGALGDRSGVIQSMTLLMEAEPHVRDVGAYFGRHGATPEIIELLNLGFSRAESLVEGASG